MSSFVIFSIQFSDIFVFYIQRLCDLSFQKMLLGAFGV